MKDEVMIILGLVLFFIGLILVVEGLNEMVFVIGAGR